MMDWRICRSCTVHPLPRDDICWAKFDKDDDTDTLKLEDSEIVVGPSKAHVVFRQPYDMDQQ